MAKREVTLTGAYKLQTLVGHKDSRVIKAAAEPRPATETKGPSDKFTP